MKRELGQYFTITNPFELNVFKKWLNRVNNDSVYLEPFAGANNIPKLIKETGFNHCRKPLSLNNNGSHASLKP